MDKLEKLQAEYKAKMKELEEVRKLETLTDEQRAARDTLIAEVKALGSDIDAEIELRKLDAADDFSDGAHIEIQDQPIYRGSAATQLGAQLLDIRAMEVPSGSINQQELSEARSRLEQTEKRNIERHNVQASARNPEDRTAATGGFTVGVPSDGGFFLQGETAMELMTAGFNNSVVLPRCSNRTLTAGKQFVETYYIDETSRATGSRGGGVRVYTTAELAEIEGSKTKFRKIRIEPKKLTGLYSASAEMVENVTFLGQEMRELFSEEFAFKCQDLVVNGTGAGEPLGILNAPCLISVSKVTGQAADTIVTDNILDIESVLWREVPGVCYLANRECKKQLAKLAIDVGSGGELTKLYKQEFYMGVMQASLNGFPCYTIEQSAKLGDVGDIILADFKSYITANKGDINEAMSIHSQFIYHQNQYRFIYYFDGQPKLETSITPYKGKSGAKVGPFVTVAAR